MTQKVYHEEGPWGWDHLPRSEVAALACMSPHNCNVRGCPGPVNKRNLEAFEELLAALEDLLVFFKSGNNVPVERAIIHADSVWVTKARAAIERASPQVR